MKFKLREYPKQGAVKTTIEFVLLHIDDDKRLVRVLEFSYVTYKYDAFCGWGLKRYLEEKPDWKSIFRYYFLRKI